jgi:hypothetical protein
MTCFVCTAFFTIETPQNCTDLLEHPPYGPDLEPLNYRLYDVLRDAFKRTQISL